VRSAAARDGTEDDHCVFCDAMAADPGERAVEDQVLAEHGDLVLMPTVGPLVAGHALIVTATHTEGLWHSSPTLIRQYRAFVRDLRGRAAERGDSLLEVEHGGRSLNGRMPCIAHTHVHVLPGLGHLVDVLERSSLSRGIEPSYFWVSDGTDEFTYGATGAPSQLLRRAVADALGLEHWDWALMPPDGLLAATVEYWADS